MKGRVRSPLGVSWPVIFLLAFLGVPRVVAHDLGLVGPVGNALLVFTPLAVWLAVVLWRRVPNPFLTLLVVGSAYGVLLGITHQVLWTEAFPGGAPAIGGNLAGELSPSAEAVVLRILAFGSSMLTGVLTGAAAGAACWLLAKMIPGARPR